MKKNMGSVDRVIRAAIAVSLSVLYFGGILNGWVALVLMTVAVVFFITIFIGTCPLYIPLGFSTRKVNLKISEVNNA